MTRGQRIAHLANEEGFTRSEAASIVDATVEAGFIAPNAIGPLRFFLRVSAVTSVTVVAVCAAWTAWDVARNWKQKP